jgi:hypothetical protein
VGTASSHGSFHIPDVLVAPGMIHNLLSIRRFTTDNSCSVEFDLSGLTVRDLASRCPLLRCNNTGPLYTLRFPASVSPSSPPHFLRRFRRYYFLHYLAPPPRPSWPGCPDAAQS